MDNKPKKKIDKRLLAAAAAAIPTAFAVRGLGELGRRAANQISAKLRPAPFKFEELGRPWLKHPRSIAGGVLTSADVLAEMERKGVVLPEQEGHHGIEIGPRNASRWSQQSGKWRLKRIMASTPSAPVVMHEIGHGSEPLLGDTWRRLVFASRGSDGGGVSGVDAIRAGILLGALHEPGEHRVPKFIHAHAPMLAGLTYLPLLVEEARATGSALRGAYKLHRMAGVKEVIRDMGPAYASYAIPALATMGGIAAARAVAGRIREKMDSKKTAAAEPKMQGQLRLSATQANMAPVGQVKPKSTPARPGSRAGNFTGIPAAKPPSLTKYYRDFTKSLTPGRGIRT